MRRLLIIALFLIPATLCALPNSPMHTSERGRGLIKQFEGLHLKAYKCPAGVSTIGYGHTVKVKLFQTITHDQAEQFLITDLVRFEKHIVQKITKRQLRQNQFDALVSFCFNVGYRIQGTLQSAVNQDLTNLVCHEITKYHFAKGKSLAGLVRRRSAECDMYREKQYEVEPIQDIYNDTNSYALYCDSDINH